MTNVFDAANRLTSTTRASTTLQVAYNGLNDRVRQTVGATTTSFILDIAGGLPEVISTTRGTTYLHLPGVIMAQNATGQRVYLLPDGLGSIRQVMSGTTVIAQRDFDPYGNPIPNPQPPAPNPQSTPPYAFTGEWWEQDAQLLHLRARWYLPGEGIFLSKDPWTGDEARSQSMNGWSYVGGNPVNRIDPSGQCFLFGVDTLACVAIWSFIAIGGTIAVGETIYLHQNRDKIRDSLDTLPDITDYQRPYYPPGQIPLPAPMPRLAPPYIGIPQTCYWSADGCKPIPAIPSRQPGRTPGSTPGPFPIPYNRRLPTPPPTCTETPEARQLHIALGLNDDGFGNFLLLKFTWNLNRELNSQNIYVYAYGYGPMRESDTNWYDVGLSEDPPVGNLFYPSFHQAAENAEGIHFNLEGIKNPAQFADTYGPKKDFVTAYELHYLRTVRPDLCKLKTKFYQKGSVNVVEDTAAKLAICR